MHLGEVVTLEQSEAQSVAGLEGLLGVHLGGDELVSMAPLQLGNPLGQGHDVILRGIQPEIAAERQKGALQGGITHVIKAKLQALLGEFFRSCGDLGVCGRWWGEGQYHLVLWQFVHQGVQ